MKKIDAIFCPARFRTGARKDEKTTLRHKIGVVHTSWRDLVVVHLYYSIQVDKTVAQSSRHFSNFVSSTFCSHSISAEERTGSSSATEAISSVDQSVFAESNALQSVQRRPGQQEMMAVDTPDTQ